MRILIEPSDYILRNAGDMAMLQMAVTRLGKLFPNASIQILSDVPERLPKYCPNAKPLNSKGRQIWYRNGFITGRFEKWLSQSLIKRLWEFEHYLRRTWPTFSAAIIRLKLKWSGYDSKDLDEFLDAVINADVVIANGMGGITDSFPKYTTELLDTIGLAQTCGAMTAMLGQGMGPLENGQLRRIAKKVLPKVDFISLREERAGRPLLLELKVPPERIMTTGDDAIEMAYHRHGKKIGYGLGINVRASSYAAVDQGVVENLRLLFQSASRILNASLIPVPISQVPGESDVDTIRQLMKNDGVLSANKTQITTIDDVLEQIRNCRVVVSGSYHAAVFALSMGIPAIGLAKSPYYRDKFLGLADQFKQGCQVVFLDQPDLPDRLTNAIKFAWENADELHPQLLAEAEKQIELSHLAYQRLHDLIRAQTQQKFADQGEFLPQN